MTKDLIEGAAEFKHYHYDSDNKGLMQELATAGQNPKYFIISCIDSRTNPGTIFRAKPGSFFSHKAMGAIVRPYKQGTALSAALQFALEYNNIETIIVLGHTQCGAIKALADGIEDEEISSFVRVAQKAHAKAKSCCRQHEDIINKTEQETILTSTENLTSYPSVQKALSEKRITLKAWQFDIKTGDLFEHHAETQEFKRVTLGNPSPDGRQNVE